MINTKSYSANSVQDLPVPTTMPVLMPIPPDLLLDRILHLHAQICKLDNLCPSDTVNDLFSRLVNLCIRPCTIEILHLSHPLQKIRSDLIHLCGQAEGLLESHFSTLLGRLPQPHAQLHLFPYYWNYRKLAMLEFKLLCQSGIAVPKKVAFVGSGPMPLTSIVLALHHLPSTRFDNYDIDPDANELARELVGSHMDLSSRLTFHTCNIKKAKEQLGDYEVVFLAALVGMDKGTKVEVIEHLARYMKVGATLVVRSAHGARAFLYPIVDKEMLQAAGFETVSVFHPTDEVVNSVIIARRLIRHQEMVSY